MILTRDRLEYWTLPPSTDNSTAQPNASAFASAKGAGVAGGVGMGLMAPLSSGSAAAPNGSKLYEHAADHTPISATTANLNRSFIPTSNGLVEHGSSGPVCIGRDGGDGGDGGRGGGGGGGGGGALLQLSPGYDDTLRVQEHEHAPSSPLALALSRSTSHRHHTHHRNYQILAARLTELGYTYTDRTNVAEVMDIERSMAKEGDHLEGFNGSDEAKSEGDHTDNPDGNIVSSGGAKGGVQETGNENSNKPSVDRAGELGGDGDGGRQQRRLSDGSIATDQSYDEEQIEMLISLNMNGVDLPCQIRPSSQDHPQVSQA